MSEVVTIPIDEVASVQGDTSLVTFLLTAVFVTGDSQYVARYNIHWKQSAGRTGEGRMEAKSMMVASPSCQGSSAFC